MSFNYHKYKVKGEGDSFWTSYSDLFLGLSSIFLLLYVFSTLHSGTSGLKQQLVNQSLAMKVEELKGQLKIYEEMKDKYLKEEAPQGELQEYTELMDKLTLLKEEASDEKERLRQAALENERKETALNKYQQMVRNVINANKLAKTKITTRNDIITEQDVEIESNQQQIDTLEHDIRQKQRMLAEGEKKIQDTNQLLERKARELKAAFERSKLTRKAYEARMGQLKKDAERKLSDLETKNEGYEGQIAQANQQLGSLKNELSSTNRQLGSVKGELESTKQGLAKAQSEASGLQSALSDTRGQLAKAKAEIEARKEIAKEIKRGLDRAGVKAEVDLQSGEVVLDFGNAYFEINSDRMKAEMRQILERAMPAYAQSLFGNPRISNKISSVEIIGFASPTYKGRFIDPKSSNQKDKEAIQYNMDLSYRRARSIFNHILDDQSFHFSHQNELVPLLKVSGRSFLELFKNKRTVASDQFCKVNDCKKAQRVIIRFNVNERNK